MQGLPKGMLGFQALRNENRYDDVGSCIVIVTSDSCTDKLRMCIPTVVYK
jgi:hypothetical protein